MNPKAFCNQHPVQSRLILRHFCNKWAVPVLEKLEVHPTQFGELRRSIQGISQRMLTLTLRELEDDFLVIRNVLPTYPPKVEYSLSPQGIKFKNKIHEIIDWYDDQFKVQKNSN
jgi:DNA-binding HxlR family transcriptional regulator